MIHPRIRLLFQMVVNGSNDDADNKHDVKMAVAKQSLFCKPCSVTDKLGRYLVDMLSGLSFLQSGDSILRSGNSILISGDNVLRSGDSIRLSGDGTRRSGTRFLPSGNGILLSGYGSYSGVPQESGYGPVDLEINNTLTYHMVVLVVWKCFIISGNQSYYLEPAKRSPLAPFVSLPMHDSYHVTYPRDIRFPFTTHSL